MIVTFYSFKGGVGRSMAIANVAEMLADAGYKVVACDFDLEAPGLERYFFDELDQSERLKSNPGIIDLLEKYKLCLLKSPREKSDGPRLPELEFPSDYSVRIDENRRQTGSIKLLTAGTRTASSSTSYERRVEDFNWTEFYDKWAGGSYLEFFREDLLKDADVVLVDSRTGVTEHGGVCTHHLADLVVILTAPNDLNMQGSQWMAKSLSRDELLRLRNGRPIYILPVAARVEQTSEKEQLAEFQNRFSAEFRSYVPLQVGSAEQFIRQSEIPYIGYYAFRERIVAREDEGKRHRGLYHAYASLTKAIVDVGTQVDVQVGSSKRRLAAPKYGPMSQHRVTVFLWYSHKDRAFVEKLVDALALAGFTPWLCEVDIDQGENFVAKIDEGLGQSDLALLVWSPDAAKSAWTEQEWTSVLARQVEEHKVRLGIILLRDHPLPPLLRTSNRIEARWDQAAGIRESLEWLKGRQRVQRLSGLKAPVYLPYDRPQDFVGREGYLARLQDALTAEPATFLLHGEPGTGKSMLALRFAWSAQKDFDAVIYQSCGQRDVDEIAAELSDRLPIDAKTLPPEEKRKQSMQWLRERESLLVLDDVWNRDVRQLAPGPSCSVLYRSRQRSLPWISAQQSLEVESFSEHEADQLFHAFLDMAFGESEVTRHRHALLEFAHKAEMLPIVVAVGASLLREKSASPLERSALKLRLKDLNDGVRDVPQLFQKAVAAQPQREQKLLAAAAVCVQEGFWLPLVAAIAEITEEEADDAAERLVNSSLLRVLDRDRRRFQLHALLREQARTSCAAADFDNLQQSQAAALERLFEDWEARWRDCRECLPEIIPAVNFLWERKESPRQTRLTYNGFAVAKRIGELDEALRILKQEERFHAGHTDREALDVLQISYGNQALILHAWGRLEEALVLLKKQEAISLELGNKDGLAVSYGNQALILKDWGRLEEALVLLKKQETISLELGNKDGLAVSYGNQALILKDWGRLEEALALVKKQEAICLELGNKDGLAVSYGNQTLILQAWGRLEEALALVKKQEAICLELGDKDALQISYGNQALILHAWGRLEEALALHKQQEAICLELGNKSSLGYCYWNWGLLAREQGNKQAERQKLEQALALFTELAMPRERDTVRAELDKTAA